MNRQGTRTPIALSWMWELLRMLTPGGRSMGPPMRSIGRELEEVWPSRDG